MRPFPFHLIAPLAVALLGTLGGRLSAALPYPIVGTHQSDCYDDHGSIPCPPAGSAWSGQDAQFQGAAPSDTDLGDGTVEDNVTGLMWVQARGPRVSFEDAKAAAASCRAGGHDDWHLPNIKELYSLMDFRGRSGPSAEACTPYLDASVFGFAYGDPSQGQRIIDAQDWSATEDKAPTMGGDASVFGVNFIDGRIKSYPKQDRRRGEPKTLYCRYVRGNPAYGKNDFVEQASGTVLDRATGLEWSQDDSGQGMDWPTALAWAQARNQENYRGHADWRLPNAKELQSLVDYGRGPDISGGAAIDPIFHYSHITNEAGQRDYPFVWSSTTHRDNGGAVYVCFGRALGYLTPPGGGDGHWVDVHGAGAQRSDPKTGDPAAFPYGHGPQGDAVRILNYVRLVRGGGVTAIAGEQAPAPEAAHRVSEHQESVDRAGGSAGDANDAGASAEPSNGQASADGGPDLGDAPARRGPPAEAVAACQGHAEGDSVTFTSPRGDTVDGICHQRGGVLIAVPAGHP